MRTLVCLALLAGACGSSDGASGLDGRAQVVTLGDADLRTLCQFFVDTACAGRFATESWCVDCKATDLCGKATVPALMRTECVAPITVYLVEQCAGGADQPAIPTSCAQGGGCVFDVGDALCGP